MPPQTLNTHSHAMHSHTQYDPLGYLINKIKKKSFFLHVLRHTNAHIHSRTPFSTFCHRQHSESPAGGKWKTGTVSTGVGFCVWEVDTGISCPGFSCGVHLVDRVGNSCLHHTKVSLLGLTVSVSVQRKESILLDYGCALSVKQQTCSVWHVSRWFVAEPLLWSVSRSCCVTALCFSSLPLLSVAPSCLPQLCDV